MKRLRIRRLSRFSLRTMLVVMVVLSVWLGITVRKAKKQKAAVEWVEEMGGRVGYDYYQNKNYEMIACSKPPPDGETLEEAKPPGPKWLHELIGVDYFATVVAVEMADGEVTDVSRLSTFTNLETLLLFCDNVTDLSPLAGLTRLKTLALAGTQITDLHPLGNLTKLETLFVSDAPVTDLSPLANLMKLKVLDLTHTQVTDLSPLKNLTSLDWLCLSDTLVSDLSPLAKLENVADLDLSGTPVTAREVANLRQALPNCFVYD